MRTKITILAFLTLFASCAQRKESDTKTEYMTFERVENAENKDSILAEGLLDIGGQWLQLDSNDYNGRLATANGYLLQKKYLSALPHLSFLYPLYKDSFYVVSSFGFCLFNLGDTIHSLALYQDYLKKDSNNAAILHGISSVYFEKRDYKRAIFYSEKISSQYEKIEEVNYILAFSLFKLNKEKDRMCRLMKNVGKRELPMEMIQLCN